MKNYDHIPQTVCTHPKSWFSWAHTFCVPKDWDYLRPQDPDYQTAETDLYVNLDTEGDWLEIVSQKENQRILFMII